MIIANPITYHMHSTIINILSDLRKNLTLGRATLIQTVAMKIWQADLKNCTGDNEENGSRLLEAGFPLGQHAVLVTTVEVIAGWQRKLSAEATTWTLPFLWVL